MVDLSIRPASHCRFNAVSLGEVLLRLDPGEGRIRTARSSRPGKAVGSTTAGCFDHSLVRRFQCATPRLKERARRHVTGLSGSSTGAGGDHGGQNRPISA